MLLVLPATRARKSARGGLDIGRAYAKYKSAQAAYQTAVIPPKGTRRQSRRCERAKADVEIRSPLRLS